MIIPWNVCVDSKQQCKWKLLVTFYSLKLCLEFHLQLWDQLMFWNSVRRRLISQLSSTSPPHTSLSGNVSVKFEWFNFWPNTRWQMRHYFKRQRPVDIWHQGDRRWRAQPRASDKLPSASPQRTIKEHVEHRKPFVARQRISNGWLTTSNDLSSFQINTKTNWDNIEQNIKIIAKVWTSVVILFHIKCKSRTITKRESPKNPA